MSEKDFLRKKNKFLPKLHAWITEKRPGEKMIPYSAAMEQKLIDFSEDEKKAYLEENKCSSQMDKIVVEGYHTLQLIHFYTCGADEVKCWTIRKGWKAPQAAGTIHTDFERGFIRAETVAYDDLVAAGSVQEAKAQGNYRSEGKEYEVKEGDVLLFRFNV